MSIINFLKEAIFGKKNTTKKVKTSSKEYKTYNKKSKKQGTYHKNDKKRDRSQVKKKVPREPQKPFSDLNIDPRLLELLKKQNFTHATKVQEKSIPITLEGKNLFCSSETGSGKTLSFLIPMMQKFIKKEIDQALIICPTREIAIQIEKVLRLFKLDEINPALVIGGTDMDEQKRQLRNYPNVLVATPGRLLDMMKTGLIWLEHTQYVVLDEADRMLDMGFEEDLLKIRQQLTGAHQIVLFSATLFPEVKKIAKQYAKDYVEVTIGNPGSIAGTVEHVLVEIHPKEKYHALEYLVGENRDKMIVFFNTIKETDSINKSLKRRKKGWVDCIHSKRSQETREKLISDFRSKRLNVLLASDVAARGIDIPNVELVVNYDLPNNPEEYVHRVGRTGRAGKSGVAISFYTRQDEKLLKSIEKLIKGKITRKKNVRDVIKRKRNKHV